MMKIRSSVFGALLTALLLTVYIGFSNAPVEADPLGIETCETIASACCQETFDVKITGDSTGKYSYTCSSGGYDQCPCCNESVEPEG